MSQVKINLDSDLVEIMTASGFNNFTVLELRSAYLAISTNKNLDKTEVRRFVYRHILRLEKKGLLKRIKSKKRDRTYYAKTDLFDINRFNNTNTSLSKEAVVFSESSGSVSQELLHGLIEKLQQYKVELLTSIGETDEYKALCLDFPELKGQLQEKYNQARDNSSKVLGRVKALESMIEQQKKVIPDNETS